MTPSFMDLWSEILAKTPIKIQELCVLICRNLWLCRNPFIFENVFTDPKQELESAFQQLETFQSASSPDEVAAQQQNSKQRLATTLCTKSKKDQVELNWDAALND